MNIYKSWILYSVSLICTKVLAGNRLKEENDNKQSKRSCMENHTYPKEVENSRLIWSAYF